MRKTIVRSTLLVVSLFVATTANAHHSFAPYETQKQIKLVGTVEEFLWQNPHVYIQLKGGEEGQEERLWLIECANPGILNRVGWKFNMIKKGDRLVMAVAPMRNGQAAALLKGVKLPDGRTFDNGGPAGPATISLE